MPLTNSAKFVDSLIIDQAALTATADDVVAGKGYIGADKVLASGTLPLLEEANCVNVSLAAGQTYTVPFAKIARSFTISAQALSDQTSGTAAAADILLNKTAWVNGRKITGTMPNNGSVSQTVDTGDIYTIPMGYHDGTGTVRANSLASQTDGTAVAADLLANKTAWVNGVKITGTMNDRGSVSVNLNAGESYTIAKGYHDGTGVVSVTSLPDQTTGTATADDIVYGETAWVNGEMLTGTIVKISPSTIALPLNGSYTIPRGYHGGLGKVTQNIPTMSAFTVTPAATNQVLHVAGNYMTGDITVTGIDALNYQREYETPIIPYTALVFDSGRATAKLSVDNWHDNATLNVYKVILTDLVANDGYTISACDGTVVYDWNGSAECTEFSTTISGANIRVDLSLESGTNAHTFTISSTSHTFVSGYIRVIEIFRARQYGVDYS